jgi:uncharacterized protein YhfF
MLGVRPVHAPDLDAVIEQVREKNISLPPGPVSVTAYGDSPEMSDELLELIISGTKTAGSTLVWALDADGEAAAQVGDIEIIVDAGGNPRVVTRIVESNVVPFSEVGAEYAVLEGEGDRTLEFWRETHWDFFSRECARLGCRPSEDMPVSCAIFEVVEIVSSNSVQP